MVVLPGRSSSLLSIKGVAKLISKLKPFKMKAFSWFQKLVTWKDEERWSLCDAVSRGKVVSIIKEKVLGDDPALFPSVSRPVSKEVQGIKQIPWL